MSVYNADEKNLAKAKDMMQKTSEYIEIKMIIGNVHKEDTSQPKSKSRGDSC